MGYENRGSLDRSRDRLDLVERSRANGRLTQLVIVKR